ncbi:hypothetical protein PAXRUDRAFT_15495 [Paxillus rubicundulus Ve08.2h10]|uniref:Uncharacterized protein n=1 Tax=Paxillus rubicundulus Ve08.2h10 TaxID=930991 RepID=A0A0D0DPQ1_9AGAM|nr:hypothetical protein PAXRUDRAFT_15495 [Paxillus rubicundulus Ve08.2h10]
MAIWGIQWHEHMMNPFDELWILEEIEPESGETEGGGETAGEEELRGGSCSYGFEEESINPCIAAHDALTHMHPQNEGFCDGMDAETDEESQDESGDGDCGNNSTTTHTRTSESQNGQDYSIELHLAPSIEEAQKALVDLRQLLKPRRADGTGYENPKLNRVLLEHLERMLDHGWLHSPDRKETAQVLFKVGKSHNGYFTNQDIFDHAKKAMDILEKYYPDEDHILVFDNATTHLKRADDALSAWKMPKNHSATWGIPKTVKDTQGRATVGADGKF